VEASPPRGSRSDAGKSTSGPQLARKAGVALQRCRLSARRAYDIGLVSEIAPKEQLHERTAWAANAIASQPPLAIEGTVRAIWGARELGQRQALRLGYAYVGLGTNQDSIAEGQKLFESGTRIDWRSR